VRLSGIHYCFANLNAYAIAQFLVAARITAVFKKTILSID
jgi:hypothetical protein